MRSAAEQANACTPAQNSGDRFVAGPEWSQSGVDVCSRSTIARHLLAGLTSGNAATVTANLSVRLDDHGRQPYPELQLDGLRRPNESSEMKSVTPLPGAVWRLSRGRARREDGQALLITVARAAWSLIMFARASSSTSAVSTSASANSRTPVDASALAAAQGLPDPVNAQTLANRFSMCRGLQTPTRRSRNNQYGLSRLRCRMCSAVPDERSRLAPQPGAMPDPKRASEQLWSFVFPARATPLR